MSKYTTGELAKLCGVTVRTVQYYDARGILSPSELTEGGRRLYSEDDCKRMKIICFLRELGLPIDAIGQLLAEEDPGSVIALLLDQQEQTLRQERDERERQLQKLAQLRSGLNIAYIMTNKQKLRRIRLSLLLTALPVAVLQWASIILWITRGMWWLFALWVIVGIPYGVWASLRYFRKIAYICPQCHTVFQPKFKEAFWARHTPVTRRLTCPHCGHRGFCVEAAAETEEEKHG